MNTALATAATARPEWPPETALVALDSVDSTNDEARRQAAAGGSDPTWVWAARQEAGRGRRGRSWVSPAGNLHASVLLRPARPTAEISQLSFVAALAAREAVRAGSGLAPDLVRLKWPNDVLVRGRKIAGILLEAEPQVGGGLVVVAGIGINLRDFPTDTEFPATALAAEEGAEVPETARMMALLAGRFQTWYGHWQTLGFGPVRAAWLAAAHGLGEPVQARLASETVGGVFRDLDAAGALVLETADGGRRVITAGDVFFRHAGAGPGE